MSDEKENENPDGNTKQIIDSVTALTKAVPIYEDAIQPGAKEVGKALATVGKAVNVALAPIKLMVWGYDKIEDFLENKVSEKLEKIPEERITTPPPNVAGPAIEALRFTGENETLRDMFANLIANSLDSKTVMEAHPSFVDIIKGLSPDEGLILKAFSSTDRFPVVDINLKNKDARGYNVLHRNVSQLGIIAGCQHPELTPNYLDNLCRLGILEIPSGLFIVDEKAYEAITNEPDIKTLKEQYDGNKLVSIDFKKKFIATTGMGRQFVNACIIDKRTRE